MTVESCLDESSDTAELETYNQCMTWLDEARTNFSSWYDRQTKTKMVMS